MLPLLLVAVGAALIVGSAVHGDAVEDDEPTGGRRGRGAAIALVAGAGLLHVANGARPSEDRAGPSSTPAATWARPSARPLHAILDTAGAAVLLTAVLAVGILVATGLSVRGALVGRRGVRAAGGVARAGAQERPAGWTTFGEGGSRPEESGGPTGDAEPVVDGERAGWFDDTAARRRPTRVDDAGKAAAADGARSRSPDPREQLEIDLGPAGEGVGGCPPLNLLKRTKAAEVDRRPDRGRRAARSRRRSQPTGSRPASSA